MISPFLQRLVAAALEEDLDEVGDLTARYFVPASSRSLGVLVAREPCTLAGIELAAGVFSMVDPELEIRVLKPSASRIAAADVDATPILEVQGATRSIVTAERTALNFAQRLSGVATLTAAFVEAVAGTEAVILDTRKTTPGWRRLEKEAVRMGGGQNHRLGLYDRVMVKDNHLAQGATLDSLQEAIDRLKADHPNVEVELEADTLDQVRSFLTLGQIDFILLDNMNPDEVREAVALARGHRVRLEASGGMQLETVRSVAEAGVDFISVGAITHSARAVDLALELQSID